MFTLSHCRNAILDVLILFVTGKCGASDAAVGSFKVIAVSEPSAVVIRYCSSAVLNIVTRWINFGGNYLWVLRSSMQSPAADTTVKVWSVVLPQLLLLAVRL
jgi:hypothetical protein